MALNLKRTENDINRIERQGINDNWTKIENNFNNVVNVVSDEAFQKVVDSAKLIWQSPVDNFAALATTYPSPEIGWASMARDTGTVYRWDGSAWLETLDITVGPLNEIDGRLSGEIENLKTENPLYLTDFGADRTGINSSTSALQNAINAVAVQRRKIIVPAGDYIIDASIIKNLNALDLIIEGEASGETFTKTRLLWRGGAGRMFNFTNGRNVIFRNIEITGYNFGVDTDIYVDGSTGIYSQSNLILENCDLSGFQYIAQWNGGYYHRITNCSIQRCEVAFYRFSANNLTFTNCKVIDVARLATVTGGSGTVSLMNCSIEKFTQRIIAATDGARSAALLVGCYIENYPNQTPPAKLGPEYRSIGISGFSNVTLMGNTIFAKGVTNVVYGNALLKQVVSLGNRIIFNPTQSDLAYYIYKPNAIDTVVANDVGDDSLAASGTAAPQYISDNNIAIKTSSSIYNPFTRETVDMTVPLNDWIPLTLINGWISSSSSTIVPSYRKNGHQVELKGVIDGQGASDTVFALLPAGYRTPEGLRRVTLDLSNEEVTSVLVSRLGNLTNSKTPRPTQLLIDLNYNV